MVTSTGAASWQPLHDTFYRLTRTYALEGTPLARLDLADYRVAHCSHAGPIAVMRDPSRPVPLGKYDAKSSQNRVSVYTPAGALVQHITWDAPSPIVHLSLPTPTTLLLLTASGLYRLYALSAHPSLPPSFTQHDLPRADDNGGVADAQAYDGGIVVRFRSGAFVDLRGVGARALGDAGAEGGAKGKRRARADGDSSSVSGGGGGGKPVPLAATGLDAEIACWAVVPAEASAGAHVEVLVGAGETVYRLDEIECVDQRLTRGPYLSITPSPSGRFLALLLAPSTPSAPPTLWVTSADFSRSLSEVVLDSGVSEGEKGYPDQVQWCGSNAVVLAWERTVVLVGPFGETLKWFYPSTVHLIPEPDGARLLSSTSLSLLSLVPPSTQSIFLPGSTAPPALLYEAAREFYDRKSPRADEYVRALGRGSEMREAVEGCLEAARAEWDEAEQKRLLKAAVFGKSFLEVYDPTPFVQTTQGLRVLNAVRAHTVGVPLTWEQFHSRPASALIAHLLALNAHLLALRLSAFLSLPPAPVVRHWAAALIAASAPGLAHDGAAGPVGDEEVCARIVDKLDSLASAPLPAPSPSPAAGAAPAALQQPAQQPPLSSADLALAAFRLGRPQLAKLLLDREPRAARQVALLLRMGEGETAASRAVESGDPELVFEALLALRRALPAGDLFALLARLPRSPLPPPAPLPPSKARAAPTPTPAAKEGDGDALRLLQVLCLAMGEGGGEEAREWSGLVRDWWYLDDRRVEMGVERLREAGRERDFGEKVALVRQAQKSFAEDKERGFEAKMVDDHVRLLVFQESLEQDAAATAGGKMFVGLSVNETLRACLLAGMDKRAEKLRGEFKVPDKRYWYLKLRALIALRDWDALDAFAKSKKSPIGYEPFVLELIRAGAHRQAVRFVERCEARERVELFIRAGEWEAAGREDLRSRAPNKVIAAQLEELLQEMNNAGA
ncbi:Vacuolar protein sorting-associated protein 16 [Rhodotorula kratochvilovae]